MDRLLSPNEAKFWLLDQAAPMNSVVVVQRAGPPMNLAMPVRFALPVARAGKQGRPRWGEAAAPGILRHETVADDLVWLGAAEALLDIRVGSETDPPWHAVVQNHPGGSTFILAVNHAATDWRTGLLVARSFLSDTEPGEIAPACEEMLPAEAFGDPEAGELLDEWWSDRAGARWEALGIDKLTAILPPASPTRLSMLRMPREATERLQKRCEDEGASLNGAVAVALRDAMGIDVVAHSIDMGRFIRPPLPPGPGLAVSHVFTPLAAGGFWEAARENRTALFEQVQARVAGDALLALPRMLLRPTGHPGYQRAAMTITGAPTVRARDDAPAGQELLTELVLSSARGGGGILILSYYQNSLQLIAGSPNVADIPLQAIIERLMSASY